MDIDTNVNIGVPYLQRLARTANSNRYESEETTGVGIILFFKFILDIYTQKFNTIIVNLNMNMPHPTDLTKLAYKKNNLFKICKRFPTKLHDLF